MDNYAVRMDLDISDIQNRSSMEFVLQNLSEVFFAQLTQLWGCNCVTDHGFQPYSICINISCPELLAHGIEHQLGEILEHINNPEVYVISSYPHDHRPREVRLHEFSAAAVDDSIVNFTSMSASANTAARSLAEFGVKAGILNIPAGFPKKIIEVEIPKKRKKRIVNIDIK